ncbi:Aste57867_9654 [Aphanomyces stellatus]|uniref:Aste57867_9654 protein n=1 Tax=Aphanomyces stellatus TaxID=120398 RepID=A0A485KNH3_9STRA|nr:hypothetical protein As57867_009616 [Aphanomyces stellatus]VFT86533.1 Aste57867_9654 [Aphanomyces stellatus]
MAAQLRLPVWRQLAKNFSSRAESSRPWTPRKPEVHTQSAHKPAGHGQASFKHGHKPTPAAAKPATTRKTWDKELKAWVPYVDKDGAAAPVPTPRAAAGKAWTNKAGVKAGPSSPRQWLKPTAVVDDPHRFKLFSARGEVNVDRAAMDRTTKVASSTTTAGATSPTGKKSFAFEKSLFSNDFFPDVSWNSKAAKTKHTSGDKRSGTTARPSTRAAFTRKTPQQFFKENSASAFREKKQRFNMLKKAAPPQKNRKVEIPSVITVEALADRMGVKSFLLVKTLRALGERHVQDTTELSAELAELAVEDMGMIPILVEGFVDLMPSVVPDDVSAFPARPPVVTVMGHVDHGKTTLLDALRQTTTTEAGGITQKIGSFTVPIDDTSIVFFDTPGHAAFATMRAQGCSLTDILVVVIAADDGIQPQTREVLRLATDHGVPLIVAITKCDRFPGQEDEIVTRISDEVMREGILEEDMQLVCVSGKTGEGLDELKQAIVLQAEIMDLRAPRDVPGEGVVVEGSVVRGWGVTVDMMVTWGSLKVGQLVVCGLEYGKIKNLIDEHGTHLTEAGPGTPIRMVGLKDLPKTGQSVLPVASEDMAKTVVAERARILELIAMKEAEAAVAVKEDRVSTGRRGKAKAIEAMRQERAEEEKRQEALTPDDEGYVAKVVPVVLKANALGIIDAIDHMIAEMNLVCRECVLKRIHAGVGPVTTSDIDLAVRTNATIFTFNTRQPGTIDKEAHRKQVTIKSHNIIYSLMDDIETLLTDHMTHEEKEEPIGAAEVLEHIPINLRGRQKASIAGVRVTDGQLQLDAKYRIVRDGDVIATGLSLESMRHFQDKISESPKGQECGIQFADDDAARFKVGDVIQAYRVVRVRPKLLRD